MSEHLASHKADVTIPVYGTIADADVYLKDKVDAILDKKNKALEYARELTIKDIKIIDEQKAEIAELKAKLDEYVLVKLSTQQILQNLVDCGLLKEWYFNGKFNIVLKADDPHLQIKELNAKLKESENARYEAGADAADYYQENRRLRRALYKACANWADAEVFERTVGIDDPNVEANRWALMRNKCLKKAEEYK